MTNDDEKYGNERGSEQVLARQGITWMRIRIIWSSHKSDTLLQITRPHLHKLVCIVNLNFEVADLLFAKKWFNKFYHISLWHFTS